MGKEINWIGREERISSVKPDRQEKMMGILMEISNLAFLSYEILPLYEKRGEGSLSKPFFSVHP